MEMKAALLTVRTAVPPLAFGAAPNGLYVEAQFPPGRFVPTGVRPLKVPDAEQSSEMTPTGATACEAFAPSNTHATITATKICLLTLMAGPFRTGLMEFCLLSATLHP